MPLTDQQRIEQLEAEIAFLKQELGLSGRAGEAVKLQVAFGLTQREADVLLVLYRRHGRLPMSREALFEAVWGLENEGEMRAVEVYVCRLRKKLGAETIKNVWGHGYSLAPDAAKRVKEQLDILPS